MSNTHEQYQEIHHALENDVIFSRDQIEIIVQFLGKVYKKTIDYANKRISQKVDNTLRGE